MNIHQNFEFNNNRTTPRLSNKLTLDSTQDSLGVPKINIYWTILVKLKDTEVVKTMAKSLTARYYKIKFKNELLSGESHKIGS